MEKTLFIGNGINRLSDNNTSWENILRDLAKYVNKADLLFEHIDDKPFTLVFEEIFLRSANTDGTSEIELKKRAAKLINNIPHNNFHTKTMNSSVKHIITTNYDYNFENSIISNENKSSTTSETKYSLYRRRTQSSKNVWHIHGESSIPNTLMLGHEHYSGSLQRIRSYLTSRKKTSPFMLGIFDFDRNESTYSWVDIFLRDEIHILGFSLDYTEIDIWWLLSYKERLRLGHKRQIGKTFFHQFHAKELSNKDRAKLGLLESFGVNVISTKVSNSYQEAYEKTFRKHFQ